MPPQQFQTVCTVSCSLPQSMWESGPFMDGFYGHTTLSNNTEHLVSSQKKEALEYILTKNPRWESCINKYLIAYLNINYLKTFNPISTYGRLTNVMNTDQHNIMLRLSGIVNVCLLIELF